MRWFGEGLLKVQVRSSPKGFTSLVCALWCSFTGACSDRELPTRDEAPAAPAPVYEPAPQPDLCARRIDQLVREEKREGAPPLGRHRAEILARARSVPVVFHTRPAPPENASVRVASLRASLLKDDDPAHAILQVLRKTRGNYSLRRQVFLSDGYLYADEPMLGLRMSQVLRLDHLFSKQERELVIERGTETISVSRREGRYFLPPIVDDGDGARHHVRLASLLLFDRVRTDEEEFGRPLHVDLRNLQQKLGFSSAEVSAMSERRMVLDLSTYGARSRAVVTFDGALARLECETAGETPLEVLAQARSHWHSDRRLIDPVLRAAHEMIRRRLPFDEPKTEEGQQDGLLRLHFRQAYKHYGSTYEFNGDSYYVFDGYGRPRLPQVCIDFITDAFDWGTGGHWPERGKKRVYKKGALHFASMGMENPRSVENLAGFATENPDWFDVVWLPKPDRIKFRHRKKFFAALATDADNYRRGDIVFIYGLRDDGKFHYHSFLIDEKDPVTGMPTVVVANAGPPQARSWEGEMQNAPLRSIVARVRVRRNVLERAHAQARLHPGIPLEPPRPVDDAESISDEELQGTPPEAARTPADFDVKAVQPPKSPPSRGRAPAPPGGREPEEPRTSGGAIEREREGDLTLREEPPPKRGLGEEGAARPEKPQEDASSAPAPSELR